MSLHDLIEFFDLYLVEPFRGQEPPPISFYVALVLATVIIFVLWKARRNYERLSELQPAPAGFEPDVAVIIPARDEEANIEGAVRSFAGAAVIVVDDDSSDKTAEIARREGAHVISAPPLKKNMLGKPNACWAGSREAQSKWLLFVDADTRFKPGALAALVYYAESKKLDAVTMFLRQECVGGAERMILPYALALYFCGITGLNVNRMKSSEALANGQCFLVRRDSYESMGGHMTVADSVVEDVALARNLKRNRCTLRVLRGEKFGSVRMYDGFSSVWHVMQKNAFRFLLINPWTGFQVAVSSILLSLWLPVLVWLLIDRQWLMAVPFALMPSVMLRRWYGSITDSLLVPGAIYIYELIALAGMYVTSFGRPTEWKGRTV